MTQQHFGHAGHFIAAARCRFHLCTLVNGKHLVSTVGDYRPNGYETEAEPIGHNRLFETMAFPVTGNFCSCGCGVPEIDNAGEPLDFAAYNDAKAATAGHAAMVAEFEALS